MHTLFSYNKILDQFISHLDFVCKDENIRQIILIATDKVLKTLKKNTLLPVIYPLLLEKDLNIKNKTIALELTSICIYFYSIFLLIEELNNNKENTFINIYGKEQTINIIQELNFIVQELINNLKIADKNKINLLILFSKASSKISSGNFYNLLSANNSNYINDKNNEDIIALTNSKYASIEATFMSCIFVALDKDYSDFYLLGVLIGTISSIFNNYMEIWGEFQSEAINSFKMSLPIFSSINDKAFSKKIRIILAGNNNSFEKQIIIKRFLSLTEALEQLKYYSDFYFEKINQNINNLNLNLFKFVIDNLSEKTYDLIEVITELRKICEKDYLSYLYNLEENIKISYEYLIFDKSFRDTWIIHRNGYLDEKILIGNILPSALILETLCDYEFDIEHYIQDFILLKNDVGWRFYYNSSKSLIDINITAQILILISKLKKEHNYDLFFKKTLDILENNIEYNGRCLTWIADEIFYTKDIINSIVGSECLGVMANLYYALYLFDAKKYENIIEKGMNFIINNLSTNKENYSNNSYYTYYYTIYLIIKLTSTLSLKNEKIVILKNLLLKEQFLDGSWNRSPQDTAIILLTLNYFDDIDIIVFKTGAKYLAETQNYDGSWEGENIFICSTKNNQYNFYKNRKVTTSFCLRALSIANERITKYKNNLNRVTTRTKVKV
ncbi:MAG: hypothetical protein U0457_03305 [Candidatus Sericytochromatia bacterium]